ncbi:MAG: VTT domain-containing protein [Propionibacteriaceae bacterium]|nr:VTT domain-containing protein [Propionibacteriaceae bacterium]
MPSLLVPLLPDWLDPVYIIQSLGNWALWGVALILFIECCIFPVLPGDSLLFTVGMFIAMEPPSITFPGMDKWQVLIVSTLVLTVAAIAGNVGGYWVGRIIGPPIFKPRDGWAGKVFDPKYVDKTHELLGKYGNQALVLARFVPFVRTFVTIIAGIGKMNFRSFISWTALGGLLWAVGVTLLGFFLGNVPLIRDHIEAVLVMIVLVSIIPMVVEFLVQKKKAKAAE